MVDKKDRRVNNVMLTEEGERLKESTKAIAIDAMNKIFSGFSEQELMVFATVLQRACDNIPEGNA